MHYHIAIYACMYIKLYNGAAECVHRETKNVILGVGYAKNKTVFLLVMLTSTQV